MQKRFGLLLALLLPFTASANDPLDWTELQLLYHSDLAIDAQLVRQDDAHFWVRVNTVLRDQGYGITAGDAIRVDKAASYECGFPLLLGDRRRWRLYLQKEEGKGHWALTAHSADNAIEVIGERAIIYMPTELVLPIDVLDRCLTEFQTCYALADSADNFTAICDQARIDSLATNNAVLAQFEKQGRTVTAEHLFAEPVPPAAGPAPTTPIRACVLLEQRPRAISEVTEPDSSSIEFLLPDPTPGAPGSATVIMHVRIDTEGRMQDATILRGSTPARETEALRALAAAPRVEPGRDRGVPTACQEVIPFRFTLTEE